MYCTTTRKTVAVVQGVEDHALDIMAVATQL